MSPSVRRIRFHVFSILRHDLKASIAVLFVALPLCLGIPLASGAPLYSGLVAGIVGGLVVALLSGSQLSVSGPAAGLTAICAAAILELGSMELFAVSVMLAGLLQVVAGSVKLGGFTAFIPTAVIKGMLAAIGILLASKQVPILLGYDEPDFWSGQLVNILTFRHGFSRIKDFIGLLSLPVFLLSLASLLVMWLWESWLSRRIPFLPAAFVVVFVGTLLAMAMQSIPSLALAPNQFVHIPEGIFGQIQFPAFAPAFKQPEIWKQACIICFVASLETLLSIEAVDKLDPYNRITPQNRELVAQGGGNLVSGLLGGLPITAVIVRSSANAEAGARSRWSAFAHGLWLLLVVLFGLALVNRIPYCVLAVILLRTGLNLAKPALFRQVFRQGREQWMPFLVTILAILLTDLLIGVLIGLAYSIYFLIKHTYRAGYTVHESVHGQTRTFDIQLALNVSFLNKKKIQHLLERIPPYSVVRINGAHSVYIDHDILEIFQDFRSKAHLRHIQLETENIPEVETLELH